MADSRYPHWARRIRAIILGPDPGGLYRVDTNGNPMTVQFAGDVDPDDIVAAQQLIAAARADTSDQALIDHTRYLTDHMKQAGAPMSVNPYPGDDTLDPDRQQERPTTLADIAVPAPRRNPDSGQFVPVTESTVDPILRAAAPNLPRTYPAPPENDGRPVNDLQALDPLTDTGSHHINPEPPTVRVPCTACKGTGHAMRTVSELLRESIALVPADSGQQVIREFYRRLLTAAPDLAPLFPADLITAAVDATTSPGAMQRDRLLQALAALAELYGTTPADRTRLDTALRAYGRSHAAFARPDGTTRGATIEEYMAVKQTLLDTLHTAAGAAWLPEYDDAWGEAYDYAAIIMLHEQVTSGMTMARYPRETARP